VRDLTTDPDDAAVVMAIIRLAHNLGLRVIAEGVETEEQLSLLHLLRCDGGQGYLFGRPMPADVFAFHWSGGDLSESKTAIEPSPLFLHSLEYSSINRTHKHTRYSRLRAVVGKDR
jgi:predicted signal transduction protein with EAL and GGDEF domain